MSMNEVEEFIHRRFPVDCSWTSGNCYYFALILKDRFKGALYYNPVEGHFLCKIGSEYYDYTGKVDIDTSNLYYWDYLRDFDSLHYEHIVRDCCL